MIFEAKRLAKQLRINNVVVWGYKNPNHSHHYIHKGFFQNFRELGLKTIWVEDKSNSNKLINDNSLIFTIGQKSKYLNYNKFAKYCIHNPDNAFFDQNNKNHLTLQVITKNILQNADKLLRVNQSSYLSIKDNTLYQAWGTPLLKQKFFKPMNHLISKYEFFVGSIWNNEFNQGNINIIENYIKILKNYDVKFIHCVKIPDFLQHLYIRYSTFASAVVGNWQKQNNYIPCRIFKAISYGKIGSINMTLPTKDFNYFLTNNNLANIIDKIHNMNDKEKIELIEYQQESITKETYAIKIINILKSFQIKYG